METYHYDDMPFCRPADTEPTHKAYGIGEILEGNELVDSGLEFKYAQDTAKAAYCSQTLSEKDVKFFKAAISNHYWYQLYLDDLPMWGMVGQILGTAEELAALEKQAASGKGDISAASSQVYMYTHKKFSIASNGHHVIEVNLTSAEPVEVVAGQTVSFSYEVHWVQSSKQFGERFNRYLDHSFFEHQIHWFSIFNSFMMVVFLCGLVALILLRVLRNDYAKYMREDDELSLTTIERSMPDDSGWKQVHGDVFRPPAHLELFAIVYGTGCQLVVLVFAVVLQAMLRELCVFLFGFASSLPSLALDLDVLRALTRLSSPRAGTLSAAARRRRSLFFTPSRAS
jgi:transmembrane 9 superfamily protein 3